MQSHLNYIIHISESNQNPQQPVGYLREALEAEYALDLDRDPRDDRRVRRSEELSVPEKDVSPRSTLEDGMYSLLV